MSEDRSTEEAGEPTNTPESFEKQQETIAALQEQLAQANERDRENRRIIAALTQRIPAMPPSWGRRIILIVVVAGVLAVLAALAWPTIEKPLGLRAVNLSRLWAAIIGATTFSIICSLVYFVAKKSLWDFLDLLIVPLALAIIGFGFAAQQQARQTQLENQRDARAQAVEEQRAQNEALQAYLDQMNNLMLEKGLLRSKVG